jgi:type IV secretory pathway VirB6-like protein
MDLFKKLVSIVILLLIICSLLFTAMSILQTKSRKRDNEYKLFSLLIVGNSGSVSFWILYLIATILDMNHYKYIAMIMVPISVVLLLFFIIYLIYCKKKNE